MRIYTNFEDAYDEIKRNVSELGTTVSLQTVQDIKVEGDKDYDTKELIGESYKLIGVTSKDIATYMKTQKMNLIWADKEFEERISGKDCNPGTAWEERKDVWEKFIHKGKFSYTYPERLSYSLNAVISELNDKPSTRQAVVAIWCSLMDPIRLGKKRVPCSIYYQFILRQENDKKKLHMIYTMRSSDIITHFVYDVYLAIKLQEYVAKKLNAEPASFTHFIGSMHAYRKDLRGIF